MPKSSSSNHWTTWIVTAGIVLIDSFNTQDDLSASDVVDKYERLLPLFRGQISAHQLMQF